jgi:hypothetical protein
VCGQAQPGQIGLVEFEAREVEQSGIAGHKEGGYVVRNGKPEVEPL